MSVKTQMEEELVQADIGTLFHGILFAYQKTVKDFLGTGAAIFVHPVLKIIKEINERSGVNLIKGGNIDEIFENLSKHACIRKDSKFLRNAKMRKSYNLDRELIRIQRGKQLS